MNPGNKYAVIAVLFAVGLEMVSMIGFRVKIVHSTGTRLCL